MYTSNTHPSTIHYTYTHDLGFHLMLICSCLESRVHDSKQEVMFPNRWHRWLLTLHVSTPQLWSCPKRYAGHRKSMTWREEWFGGTENTEGFAVYCMEIVHHLHSWSLHVIVDEPCHRYYRTSQFMSPSGNKHSQPLGSQLCAGNSAATSPKKASMGFASLSCADLVGYENHVLLALASTVNVYNSLMMVNIG